MITHLTIRNFALIDSLSLEPRAGLNVFTGETGAGKSILIDAIRCLLGGRFDNSQIRNPDDPCLIEAVFDLSGSELKNHHLIKEYTEKDESTLIIRRVLQPDSRNKIKINDLSVTVSALKDIGNLLLDFHGPHDHQQILRQDSHIELLDRLCGIDALKTDYDKMYKEYSAMLARLEDIKNAAESREREMDMLSHQLKELEQVSLEETEYRELISRQTRLNNTEKLCEHTNAVIEILDNEQTGITNLLSRASSLAKTLSGIDEKTSEYAEKISSLQETSIDLLRELQDYAEKLTSDANAEEAAEINRKCDAYYDIKRKYGQDLNEALAFYEKIKERHAFLLNLEHNSSELVNNIKTVKEELLSAAAKISKIRKKTAAGLQDTIEKELRELGIIHVRFECRISKTEINRNGQDEVVFYISPNAGEDLKPLADIVSSGESARVMLALKKALINVDPVPVLIFDEIDAQIGGRLGTVTGQKLRDLAKKRQVVLITHLPQIASFANTHFKVIKQTKNNKTFTTARELDNEEKVKELAKMMSGDKETEISITHANEMLSRARP